MANQDSSSNLSLGCGLAGCLGGLLLGIGGSSLLALLIAGLMAVNATVPRGDPASPTIPDLSIIINESFLNRFAEQPADGSLEIDLLPGNQAQIIATSMIEAFGLVMPVEITGLFQISLQQQSVQISLVDVRIIGFELESSGLFEEDVAAANQNLQMMLDEISRTLGVPIQLTRLETSDTQLLIEIREVP